MTKSSKRLESLCRDVDAPVRRLDAPSMLIMCSLPRHMRIETSAGCLEDTYLIGAEGRRSVHENGAQPLYCERVVNRDAPLHVRDSRQETEWADNEDRVEFGLSNYLGCPIHIPDDTPYGTACVLGNRPRDYSTEERVLLEELRRKVEVLLVETISRPKVNRIPRRTTAPPPPIRRGPSVHVRHLPHLLPLAPVFLLPPATFAADTLTTELLHQAEAEHPAYLDTLQQLVAADDGAGQVEGLGQLSALPAECLQTLGAQVHSAPATPSASDNLVVTLDGTGGKRLLLIIHCDIVFAAGNAAKCPFRKDAERAYGPGVTDTKDGVAMVLHVLALLRQQGLRDYGRITMLFNPDEETGFAGSKQLIVELTRQQDCVFSYEPPGRDAVTVATNGVDGLPLEAKGRSSHVDSASEQGHNAILELSHQLLRLKGLSDLTKSTMLNWTLVRGGGERNIIPTEASAEAGTRYPGPAESEWILADARKLAGERLIADTEISLRFDKGRPPLVKNPTSQYLVEAAQTLCGRISKRIEPITMRFGTDVGYAYAPGSNKPAVLEALGVVGAGLHSGAEYLELPSIAPRLYLTVALIRELSANQC